MYLLITQQKGHKPSVIQEKKVHLDEETGGSS